MPYPFLYLIGPTPREGFACTEMINSVWAVSRSSIIVGHAAILLTRLLLWTLHTRQVYIFSYAYTSWQFGMVLLRCEIWMKSTCPVLWPWGLGLTPRIDHVVSIPFPWSQSLKYSNGIDRGTFFTEAACGIMDSCSSSLMYDGCDEVKPWVWVLPPSYHEYNFGKKYL